MKPFFPLAELPGRLPLSEAIYLVSICDGKQVFVQSFDQLIQLVEKYGTVTITKSP